MLGALEAGHAAIRDIIGAIEDMAAAVGKQKIAVETRAIDAGSPPGDRGAGARAARRGDAREGQARELCAGRSRARRTARVDSRRRSGAARGRQTGIQGPEGNRVARRGPRPGTSSRRPGIRSGSRDLVGSRGPAAGPRVGRVHARRDPGPRLGDPGHDGRPTEDRAGRRGDLQALHAALQLPTVLRRRGQVPSRAGTARDRSWPPRGTQSGADDPERGGVPLHAARRLGHPGIERLIVHGQRMRRRARVDGRRRPHEAAGGRHRDGPHPRRRERPARRAVGHRRRRGPLRRHGLQGRRHQRGDHRAADGHQGLRNHHRDHAGSARPGACRPAPHSGPDGRDDRFAARVHLHARAAHRDDSDSGRQDPGRDRAGWQDHPQHHRSNRGEDRRRGRRTGQCGVDRRRVGAAGHRDHRGADRQPRAEQDLPRQGAANHRFRRVRGNPAGHRRACSTSPR